MTTWYWVCLRFKCILCQVIVASTPLYTRRVRTQAIHWWNTTEECHKSDIIVTLPMHIERLYTAVYAFFILFTTASCRRHPSSDRRNLMAFRDRGTSSYISCCFVDIFCYTTCFHGPGSNLRALVPDADAGSLRTSDSGRHRHRHHHGVTRFRSKRGVNNRNNNTFMRKLRYVCNKDLVWFRYAFICYLFPYVLIKV